MSILNNAIAAIQVGLEDYKSNDHRRAHSALRNIFAGILLLFKEKLSRMSPSGSDEVLIKQTIVPVFDNQGDLMFQGKGYKTVDVQQIKERFKQFDIKVQWKAFDEINTLRNNIEHYYAKESPAIVNEVVSKSFKIIRDFCVTYLEEEPVELFGASSWDVFLEADEVYESEKAESVRSLSEVDWTFNTLTAGIGYLRCPYCESDLIHVKSVKTYEAGSSFPLSCKKCQKDFQLEDSIEECIVEELAGAAHIAVMEGSDSPYTECPECCKSTYVFDDECCLNCGYSQEDKSCAVCGNPIEFDIAHDGELCSYHKWRMEKDED